MSPPRFTIRVRLALLYGALFFVSGAVLLGLDYGLVRGSLAPSIERASRPFEIPVTPSGAPVPSPGTSAGQVNPGRPSAARDLNERIKAATLRELVIQAGLALGVMAVVAGGLGWFVAGRVLRPVSRMTDKARRLSEQSLHERIDLQGPRDELKELADTFDDMLSRLDVAFDAERRFVANASHELRTPLAVARTAIDVLDAKTEPTLEQVHRASQAVRDAVDRSVRLIEALLLLARTRAGVPSSEPFDLSEVVESVLVTLRPRAVAVGLEIRPSLRPSPTTGQLTLVERMVGNLLDNAVDHNREGGWVEVVTGAEREVVFCTVSNSGPLVEQREVEELFRPFRRGDQNRADSNGGVGLGLSIVKAITELHLGTVTVQARDGGGLNVRVELPVRHPRETTMASS